MVCRKHYEPGIASIVSVKSDVFVVGFFLTDIKIFSLLLWEGWLKHTDGS